MAVTKIHPIRKTLKLALDYIMNDEKTDNKILVSSFNCNPNTAHLEFKQTKIETGSRATVLARHLIQSFAPEETTADKAHRIGIELCEKVLKGQFEYVIATHIDKGHIHNHILINNVSFVTGKAYRSNKKTYHQIRNYSDKLCKENGLSVIDENFYKIRNRYKTNSKSYYEYTQFKNGSSWKYKLKLAIDKAILKSDTMIDFIDNMENLGYEIKSGKYLSFRHKSKRDNGRFTRAKASTLGEDYSTEMIKYRIEHKNEFIDFNTKNRLKPNKNTLDNVVDIKNNAKVKSSKGYELWAKKHNMKSMAATLNEIRKYGINSYDELDNKLKAESKNRQKLLTKIKSIENEMNNIYTNLKDKNTIKEYETIYNMYKKNKNDNNFYNEYKSEIEQYKLASKRLKKSKFKNFKSKDLANDYLNLESEKEKLMAKYLEKNTIIDELTHIKKNTDKYLDNELSK